MRRSQFERVVDQVLEELPDWVLERIDNLVVVVEEHPPSDDEHLLGIYEGLALSERGSYSGALPDRIVIYRRPHLELGLDEEELRKEIRKTVLHEIAHHLGIDDARLAELGWD